MVRSERQSLWFTVSWIFLVLVVTAGFIIQQRFIDQVRRETHKFQQLAIQVSMNREEDITALCKITIQLHPDQQNEVVQAFADAGVPCIP